MPCVHLSCRYRADTGVARVIGPCNCAPNSNAMFSPLQYRIPYSHPSSAINSAPVQAQAWYLQAGMATFPPPAPPPYPPPPYTTGLNINAARAAGASAGAAAAFMGQTTRPPPPPPPPSLPAGKSQAKSKASPQNPGPQYKDLQPPSYVLLHQIHVPQGASHTMLFDGRVSNPSFTAHRIPTWAPTEEVLKRLGADKKGGTVTEAVEWGNGYWGKGYSVTWRDGDAPAMIGEWGFHAPGALDEEKPEPVWVVCHVVKGCDC